MGQSSVSSVFSTYKLLDPRGGDEESQVAIVAIWSNNAGASWLVGWANYVFSFKVDGPIMCCNRPTLILLMGWEPLTLLLLGWIRDIYNGFTYLGLGPLLGWAQPVAPAAPPLNLVLCAASVCITRCIKFIFPSSLVPFANGVVASACIYTSLIVVAIQA